MTGLLIVSALLVGEFPACDTSNLVPYRMRPHCCRSLPYYGLVPGAGSQPTAYFFDFRTEYDYPWFSSQFHAPCLATMPAMPMALPAVEEPWAEEVPAGETSRRRGPEPRSAVRPLPRIASTRRGAAQPRR